MDRTSFHAALRRAVFKLIRWRELQRRNARINLPATETFVMLALKEFAETHDNCDPTIGDIVEICHRQYLLSQSSTTTAVAKLWSSRALIDKVLDRKQPKSVLLKINEQGTKWLNREEELAAVRAAIYFDAAGDDADREVFVRTLDKIADAVDGMFAKEESEDDDDNQALDE
jgi:hypothetical protein